MMDGWYLYLFRLMVIVLNQEMPRKVTYGVDFDDDYDIYDDYQEDNYDYNYGNGIDEHDTGNWFLTCYFFLNLLMAL